MTKHTHTHMYIYIIFSTTAAGDLGEWQGRHFGKYH